MGEEDMTGERAADCALIGWWRIAREKEHPTDHLGLRAI
jgi:hypothetical protein